MDSYRRSIGGRRFLEGWATPPTEPGIRGGDANARFDAVQRLAGTAWSVGGAYVLAPTMAAVIAGAVDGARPLG